jgi:hypothetical protein
MALEPVYSRLALREKYALAVDVISPGELPEFLRPYHAGDYQIELRTLYEDNTESRRQWIFKGPGGIVRLVASFNSAAYILGAPPEAGAAPGGRRPAAPGAAPAKPEESVLLPEPDTGSSSPITSPGYTPPAAYPDEILSDDIVPAGRNLLSAVPGVVFPEGSRRQEREPDPEPARDLEGEALPDPAAEIKTGETSGDGGEGETEEGPDRSGFIEIYDENGRILEEHLIASDGQDWITAYTYNKGSLIKADTRIKYPETEEEAERLEEYCTDHYRYSRSASLRSVERAFHRTEADGGPVRLSFPHMILGAAKNTDFVHPGSAFGSQFFEDILMDSGSRVLYTVDERGRILTETRKDEDGNIIGELRNTWSGDRLIAIYWKAGEDERLTEYEYDEAGDRILERNFNRGLLERRVLSQGDQDVEELYMDGQVILRAIWEGGRKISESRIGPGEEAVPPVFEDDITGGGA